MLSLKVNEKKERHEDDDIHSNNSLSNRIPRKKRSNHIEQKQYRGAGGVEGGRERLIYTI